MRSVRIVVTLLFLLASTAMTLSAQTATTTTVSGTVFDKTGAVVPKATVELTDLATSAKRTTATGDDGGYVFPAVLPGSYKVVITASGFRQFVVSGLRVDVGKAALLNVTLQLGQMTQVVEVQAGAGTELQTLDASVGNVLDSNLLSRMPTLTRDATQLLLLQPMAIPGFNGAGGPESGEGNLSGGAVAGARADQNTFVLDGGDATSNMEGGGGYNTSFVATPRAVVPTPVESLEEFRVATNNQGVGFTRSGGAEVEMVTKRGSNDWHGAAYWYHQNDEINANDWFRNSRSPVGSARCPLPLKTCDNPELRDNRYGGRLGGPIWKDKTFFFVHEEERHFLRADAYSRLVPTDALRIGILKFPDGTGIVRAYNLNPVAVLDPKAGPGDNDPQIGTMIAPSGLDPRNKGLSPAIAATWSFVPRPNDFTGGDGLRTANYTAFTSQTTNEHFAVVRLDHKISSKWDFMTSYRYSVTDDIPSTWQVDIGGVTKGCTFGLPCPTASHPLQPRYFVAGLTGRITSNLTNDFRFNWLRHWWEWASTGINTPVIPATLPGGGFGSDTLIQIWREKGGGAQGLVPINIDTQRARKRDWNGRDYTFIDNLTWIKGKHLWTFGGRAQLQRLLHIRDDKVVGGVTTPIYYATRGGDFSNTSGFPLPTVCPSNTSGTNCIRPSDSSTNYKRAYISVTGMIDTASQVLTRDANLNPQPPFSLITQDDRVDSYELHFADTWRMTPSFTFTYGLTWGVQLPPFEVNGLQMMMVDAVSGQVIDANSLLNAKKLAALNGQVLNPPFAYVPIRKTGRKYPYDPDYTNFGPRLAAAWNPSFSGGFLGKILGDRKTVLRGGWSRAFDRINGVGIVLVPALGLGFGSVPVCVTPDTTGACLRGGTPSNNFRIGVDGNHITIPPLLPVTGAIIPGQGAPINGLGGTIPGTNIVPNSAYESRDFRIDPRRQVGGTDVIDFSIQRQLPWNMLLEVGYVGRWARDLTTNIDLNHIPYMFKPKGVNQTFAQAFDIVDAQTRTVANIGALPCLPGGGPGSSCQPWFETMLGPGGTLTAASQCGMGAHGAGSVWFAIEPLFVNGPGGTSLPVTSFNTQVKSFDWTMSNGYSNYHAGFITLRKRASQGLTFDLNYTLSHSLDNLGLTQENTCALNDAFDPTRNYESSLFDRRHTFNLLVNYELPFGKGKHFATGSVADRVFGGWSISGIYTAASGLPLFVYDSSSCGTEFGSTTFNGEVNGLIPLNPGVIGMTRNDNPTVSAFGTNSKGQGVGNGFANPDAVAAAFRYPTFADGRTGFGAVRGLFRWNVDFGVAKTTRITERVSTRFDVQFLNAFNHPMFGVPSLSTYTGYNRDPDLDLSTPATFGVFQSQFNSPRFIQIGLRIDF